MRVVCVPRKGSRAGHEGGGPELILQPERERNCRPGASAVGHWLEEDPGTSVERRLRLAKSLSPAPRPP